MRVFPKRMTDAEYVEFCRRLTRRRHWPIAVFMSIFAAVIWVMGYWQITHIHIWHADTIEQAEYVFSAAGKHGITPFELSWSYERGVVVGFIATQALMLGLFAMVIAFGLILDGRKDRLLVEYHDRLVAAGLLPERDTGSAQAPTT